MTPTVSQSREGEANIIDQALASLELVTIQKESVDPLLGLRSVRTDPEEGFSQAL